MSEDPHHHPPPAGMATPEELQKFVDEAGDNLVVMDLRHPAGEDQASVALTPVPGAGVRPHGINVPWDRDAAAMAVPDDLPKDTPIITHCGGGGRGQMGKEFLEQQGFTNVINGGGPRVQECWKIYGDK